MIDILWNFASFIIALGILVAVHEFGHFWVARRCGVKVLQFSIGFGKALYKKVGKDGTEYSLSMIPLGGYVKMVDTRVEKVPDELVPVAFDKQSLLKRSAIVFAGPAFNFIFALFAYWLIFVLGTPAIKPVVGDVAPSSIAAKADVRAGMEFVSINGEKTPTWESVNFALVQQIGESSMTATFHSPDDIGSDHTTVLDLTKWHFDPTTQGAIQSLGIVPFTPPIELELTQVSANGPAAIAGLEVGDKLISANGMALTGWDDFVNVIQAHPDQPVALQIERNGVERSITLTPEAKQQGDTLIGFAGVVPTIGDWPASYLFDVQYGPLEAMGKSAEKTWQVIELTVSMVKKLITGTVGLENLSGPISIAKGAGATAEYGLVYFLGFLALISVNLGIINLVPLPMLDGGHLLFFAIEAVIRRPISEKIQEVSYRIGGVILFSLMALAIFNDVTRL